jgi:hypothetical protein
MDGFEIDFADNLNGIWTTEFNSSSGNGTVSYTSAQARTGTGSLRTQANATFQAYLQQSLGANYTELYFAFGFRYTGTMTPFSGSSMGLLTTISSGGSTQVTLGINATSKVLEVYRGSTAGTLLASGSTALLSDTWYHIGFRVVISDTVGVAEVRINDIADITASSLDTNVANTNIATINLGISSAAGRGAADWNFDDFVVNDTSGSVANSWLGTVGIEKLTPNADGNYSAWTSTGGAVDYTEVDDVASYGSVPDDDTTTLLSSTTDQRTSVALTNTTIVGTVEGVMLCTYAKNSVSSGDQMAQGVRISSTDYDSTAFAPSSSYAWQLNVLTTSPATSARWTTSEIDGMEMGWKRVT